MRALGALGMALLTAGFSFNQSRAGDSDVLERTAEHAAAISDATPLTFENPAFTPLKYTSTLGTARAIFYRNLQKGFVNPQEGKGEGYGALEADAYIKNSNTALTGHACYRNGTIFDMQWNESGDYSRVYPYVIADAAGGNLHQERYSFGGGYSYKKERLGWGVEGAYTADLFYRKTDPRPKTITGDLRLKTGIAYDVISGYMLGISGTFCKYRQQTDIEFVSELGESKLYHLTGLGTQYARFAGVGSNVYNDSYSYGGSIDIYPSRQSGPTISARFQRVTMCHVITDLNRLPMASLWENGMTIEGGWLRSGNNGNFSVIARWDWHRRHGREGIFGDPASGSYPLIGELELFADNAWNLNIKAQGNLNTGKLLTGASVSVKYSHHRHDHISPRRHELVNLWETGMQAYAMCRAGKTMLIRLDASAARRWDAGSDLYLGIPPDDIELRSLYDCVTTSYNCAVSGLTTTTIGLCADFMLSKIYALGIELDWSHRHFDKGVRQNLFYTSLNFKF